MERSDFWVKIRSSNEEIIACISRKLNHELLELSEFADLSIPPRYSDFRSIFIREIREI
jgi:hypothetical protein